MTRPATGSEVLAGAGCLVGLLVIGLFLLRLVMLASDSDSHLVIYESGTALVVGLATFGTAVPLLITRRRHASEAMLMRPAAPSAYALWLPAVVVLPWALTHAVLIAATMLGFEVLSFPQNSTEERLLTLGFLPTMLLDAVILGPGGAIAFFGILLPWLRRRQPLTNCAALLAFSEVSRIFADGPIGTAVFWASGALLITFAWARSGSLWLPIAMYAALAALEVTIAWYGMTPT